MAITTSGGKVAAGDISGRILIWHSLQTALAHLESNTEGGSISCTTVHWHAGPVRCLAFNLDSSYLMSGGNEGVLVWLLCPILLTHSPGCCDAFIQACATRGTA